MFNNGNIAIIDIGSDKIFTKIGEIAKDNVFHIKSQAEVFYEGFMDGDWLQGDDVGETVIRCLDKALYDLNIKLGEIYIGVPGDFARVQVCSNRLNFGCSHKISANDLQTMADNTVPRNDGRFEVIDMQVVNYILDNKEKSIDPIGKTCYNLGANFSFNMCKKEFYNLFKTILAPYSRKIKFIDSSLAESLIATDKEMRIKNSAVLVDVGYLTTDISYIMGGGLIALNTLPFGGGHIAYDLSYGLELPYNTACYVKSKIDFADNDGNIIVRTDNGAVELEKSYVNMIANARLDEICEKATQVISNYKIEYPGYLKIYLTGRGLSDMKGVRAVMAKALNRQCELMNAVINSDEKNKIYLSTAGLMQFVVKSSGRAKQSFLSKFLG